MTVELPEARVEPERGGGWARLLPVAALVLAALLVREAWKDRGPLVEVLAAEGHGLAPGDPLRHLGIDVGTVEGIELAEGEDGERVRLTVRLARSAAGLAREGTRFWIARPVLGVEGVRGLETALGARYLALLPGPPGAPARDAFTALDEPPLFERDDPDALEVVLAAEDRAGLARGAPVLFRGLPIGTLLSVGLASDASAVEVRARIHGPYAELVRTDSRFYRTRGVQLGVGLTGVELSVDSLQSLWLGGVALATPTRPGPRAEPGQRFALASEPKDEWREWRPALPVGTAGAAAHGEVVLPARVHARLTFEGGGWFAREKERSGWLVRDGTALVGPADLLARPADAESAVLELGEQRLDLAAPPDWTDGALARRVLPSADAVPFAGCRRALERAEDLLVWADPALAPVALAARQLAPAEGGGWTADADFDARWHGAPVAARGDGCWVGILLVADGRGRIAGVPGL